MDLNTTYIYYFAINITILLFKSILFKFKCLHSRFIIFSSSGDDVPADQQMDLKATDALSSSASTQNLTTLLTHAPQTKSPGMLFNLIFGCWYQIGQ